MTRRGYVHVDEIDRHRGAQLLPLQPDESERARISLLIRPRSGERAIITELKKMEVLPPAERNYLSREQYEERFGASDADVAAVEVFARDNGLTVARSSHTRRLVDLSGTISQVSRAFAMQFGCYELAGHGVYRAPKGSVNVPRHLAKTIQSVMGFTARTQYTHPAVSGPSATRPRLIDPQRIARTYAFPSGSRGRGECIGIIVLGGGFYESDLAKYFHELGLPKPRITQVNVGEQQNNPADADAIRQYCTDANWCSLRQASGLSHPDEHRRRNSAKNIEWTLETTMDVELVGTWANDAHLVVYFAHNDARGKFEALEAAIHDRHNQPSVISCSWGAPESLLRKEFVFATNRLLAAAALIGVTICCASGDDGDGSRSAPTPQAFFPASSPYVLSCGGTAFRRPVRGKLVEVIWREKVGDRRGSSGHGVSSKFPIPRWQSSVVGRTKKRGRAVPDVSGKADASRGYKCVVAQIRFPGCGTSAAAPLWASLAALLNERLNVPVGYLTPLLYQERFRNAIRALYHSRRGSGWSWGAGLGTPQGDALLAALQAEAFQAA
jgi:kumamolisin